MRTEVDDALLSRCRAGDREAQRALFEARAGRVRAIALGWFGGDEAAAADVTQQVFVKVLTRLDQFRGEAAFTTWLHRVVVNECLDEARRRRRVVALDDAPEGAAAGEAPDAHAERTTTQARVRAAVARLPEKLRAAVLLRHYEGLSYDDMARVLDCSPGTVASRLSRGHAELARVLGGAP